MLLNEMVGQRLLVKGISSGFSNSVNSVDEIKILEISPSGNWVKIMNGYGNKFWKPLSDIAVIEVLKDLRELKPLM